MDNYENILNSIPEVSKERLESGLFELEDVLNLHPLLSLDDALTYIIFLRMRPDLNEDQVSTIREIIIKINRNERLYYEQESKKFQSER